MTIRQATSADLDRVMAIVACVVAEMKVVGNLQWDEFYPDIARFAKDVDNGSLFVADSDDHAIGFITIDHEEPPGYRGLPWADRSDALVIHRFAVDGNRCGVGVATALEAFVCSAASDQGITQLKVDTYSTNSAMQAFLTKKGYRRVGEMEFRGKPLPFYCYEKLL